MLDSVKQNFKIQNIKQLKNNNEYLVIIEELRTNKKPKHDTKKVFNQEKLEKMGTSEIANLSGFTSHSNNLDNINMITKNITDVDNQSQHNEIDLLNTTDSTFYKTKTNFVQKLCVVKEDLKENCKYKNSFSDIEIEFIDNDIDEICNNKSVNKVENVYEKETYDI